VSELDNQVLRTEKGKMLENISELEGQLSTAQKGLEAAQQTILGLKEELEASKLAQEKLGVELKDAVAAKALLDNKIEELSKEAAIAIQNKQPSFAMLYKAVAERNKKIAEQNIATLNARIHGMQEGFDEKLKEQAQKEQAAVAKIGQVNQQLQHEKQILEKKLEISEKSNKELADRLLAVKDEYSKLLLKQSSSTKDGEVTSKSQEEQLRAAAVLKEEAKYLVAQKILSSMKNTRTSSRTIVAM